MLKKYRPKTVFEVGTNRGTGTKIMKNALGFDSVIFSLDLPFEHIHHTLKQGTKDLVGTNCNLPYVQLRGDSMTFDFSKYPCEAAWIDSEHDYDHPYTEAKAMIKNGTKLIIFHDLHVVPVQQAVEDAFKDNEDYEVYRVDGTRIAYALKKS